MEYSTINQESVISKDMTDWSRIPDVQTSQQLIKGYFPQGLFPRLHAHTKNRLAADFRNWNQYMPEICVARQNWSSLKSSLYAVGRDLPLLVLTQISYGCGMGHSRVGIHRFPKFESEESHTYIYHATPGFSLQGGQASDYNRLDHISRKPTLYVFWVLNYDYCHQGAEELHKRWLEHRFRRSDPHQCDCATFVNDFTRHMAYIGMDNNNPFNYTIPSHTITEPVPAEDRGMYAILKYTHRPPAMLLFTQDTGTYDRICSNGHAEPTGWIVDQDAPEFNIVRQ
ncbi:MAG: hypothetical protein CENE_03671 [Candidatus Celerinatantimonas neptuna]|nr:MAG: hypothetical protein CENE_03671 [Candidatus Celerinatantimonas neptuna]